jgi:hypothetical protein
MPLILKLIALSFSLRRDPIRPGNFAHEPIQSFVFDGAQSTGLNVILTGPRGFVVQFFRHYGHPKRDFLRETVQLSVFVLFGLLFPISLFLASTVMPSAVSNAWLAYESYTVLALFVLRYINARSWATTEERIAEFLIDHPNASIWRNKELAVCVKCATDISFQNSVSEARDVLSRTVKSTSGAPLTDATAA